MDRTDIEEEAISVLKTYFRRNGYVRTYVSENDKTPRWDGNLFIYSEKEKRDNSTFLFKIPVQVKGRTCNKKIFPPTTSFSVTRKELKDYLNDGGVLYIVGLTISSETKIYISFLSKIKIKQLLTSTKGKLSFTLTPLPEKITVFLRSCNAFHLQQTKTPISICDLKDKVIQIKCAASKLEGENEYSYITRNHDQLIAKVEGLEGEFYLDCENARIKTPVEEKRIVSVNGTNFYTKITRIYEQGGIQTLSIGKSLMVTIEPKELGTNLSFSLTLHADTFDEIIHELRFLSALGSSKSLTMDGVTLQLPQLNNGADIFKRWRNTLKFWEDAQTLFQMLNIFETLDISKMEDEDYTNLRKLIQALLYNKTLTTQFEKDHLERTIVGNLNIVMLVRITGKKECKLENLQNVLYAAREDANGQLQPVPVLSKILNERPLQSNINFDRMIEDYDKFFLKNPNIVEAANEDVLLLLTHYDEKKSPILIEKANELCNWLLSKEEDNPIYLLNHLQIKWRLGEMYTHEEREKIYAVSEDDSSYTNRWAACILLGEFNRAERYWRKMSDEDKVIYVQYPIFKLLPEDLGKPYIIETNTLLPSFPEEEKPKQIC